jgi:hypothetical protein
MMNHTAIGRGLSSRGIGEQDALCINAYMDAAQDVSIGSNRFTVYHLHCRKGSMFWETYKRFSEFHTLHESICRDPQVAAQHWPPLPKKTVLAQTGEKAIRSRMKAFHVYSEALLTNPTTNHREDIIAFFSEKILPPGHSIRQQVLFIG